MTATNDTNDESNGENWATRHNGKLLVFAAATLLGGYLCYRLAAPFLPALVWAITVAVVTHRPWVWLSSRVRSPGLRAGLAVGVVSLAIVVPVAALVHFSVSEIATTIERWRNPELRERWEQEILRHPRIADAWKRLSQNADLSTATGQVVQRVQDGAAAFFAGFVYTIVQALVMLFVLFYLYRDEQAVLKSVRRYSPLSDRETNDLLKRLGDTVHATVYGTLVAAMIQGALGGLVFWFVGLPAAVLWGLVMGLLALIPYLGAFVVWAPAAAYLAFNGDWGKAAIVTVWGTVVIGLIDNLIYPMLVGNRLRQHTVVAFIAIIGGLTVFGATGLVLGPVVVTLTLALLDIWRKRTAEE